MTGIDLGSLVAGARFDTCLLESPNPRGWIAKTKFGSLPPETEFVMLSGIIISGGIVAFALSLSADANRLISDESGVPSQSNNEIIRNII